MTKWLLKKLYKAELKRLHFQEGDIAVVFSDDTTRLKQVCQALSDNFLPHGVAALGLTNNVNVESLHSIPDDIKDMLRKVL
jgi:superfamily I DNA and RNA helicase